MYETIYAVGWCSARVKLTVAMVGFHLANPVQAATSLASLYRTATDSELFSLLYHFRALPLFLKSNLQSSVSFSGLEDDYDYDNGHGRCFLYASKQQLQLTLLRLP